MSLDARVRSLLESGDRRAAVEAVMLELGPRVRGLFFTLFRRDHDGAEEAFSLFAENLWRYLGDFQGTGQLKAWVYSIARNAAWSVHRDGWRRRGRRLDTMEAEALAEEIRTKSAVRLERRSGALEALRDELDLDEQTLLTLRLDERLSWDEIAEVMSSGGEPMAPATLRKRFERLKQRLAEVARARGLLE